LDSAAIPYKISSGTVVKAIIIKKPDCQEISLDEIRKFCKDHLAPYKIPKKIEYTKELPRSHVGKVIRRKLKE